MRYLPDFTVAVIVMLLSIVAIIIRVRSTWSFVLRFTAIVVAAVFSILVLLYEQFTGNEIKDVVGKAVADWVCELVPMDLCGPERLDAPRKRREQKEAELRAKERLKEIEEERQKAIDSAHRAAEARKRAEADTKQLEEDTRKAEAEARRQADSRRRAEEEARRQRALQQAVLDEAKKKAAEAAEKKTSEDEARLRRIEEERVKDQQLALEKARPLIQVWEEQWKNECEAARKDYAQTDSELRKKGCNFAFSLKPISFSCGNEGISLRFAALAQRVREYCQVYDACRRGDQLVCKCSPIGAPRKRSGSRLGVAFCP